MTGRTRGRKGRKWVNDRENKRAIEITERAN